MHGPTNAMVMYVIKITKAQLRNLQYETKGKVNAAVTPSHTHTRMHTPLLTIMASLATNCLIWQQIETDKETQSETVYEELCGKTENNERSKLSSTHHKPIDLN